MASTVVRSLTQYKFYRNRSILPVLLVFLILPVLLVLLVLYFSDSISSPDITLHHLHPWPDQQHPGLDRSGAGQPVVYSMLDCLSTHRHSL